MRVWSILILLICAPFVASSEPTVPASQAQITLSFAPVVKKASPAVVNIYTKRTERVNAPISPFMTDPLFRQFFGDSMGLGGIPRERVTRSLGSGVVVSADGLVVTSYHVIKNSDTINIVLADKSEYEAKVDKVDEKSDLAILKIAPEKPLPFLTLRDSDTLEVGDLVLAIGNPFGVGQTVTQGIVSALARAAEGVSDYQFFIQTDAAINPGNSGGALVDANGALVGVNTAIYSTSGGSNGIGFAIPANMVKAILEGKTAKDGKLVRPWIGLNAKPVTSEIANSLGLAKTAGVIVQEVSPKGPADKAGIQAGDVILRLDGKEVSSEQELNFRVATAGLGKTLAIEVLRGGTSQVLNVVPVGSDEAAKNVKMLDLTGNHPLARIRVADITPFLAETLGLPSGVRGVVVVKNNRSARGVIGQNLRPGDIILNVNGVDIDTSAQLQEVLSASDDGWKIVFKRGNMVTTLMVTQ